MEHKSILAHISSLLELDHVVTSKQELGNVHKAVRSDLEKSFLRSSFNRLSLCSPGKEEIKGDPLVHP
jgi:hypothetical protein